MQSNNPKRVYLITYSKANLEKFPTRKSFGDACAQAFDKAAPGVVSHYACCLENHEDGSPHYHVSIKLNSSKRWKSAKDYLKDNYDIVVNFNENPDSFYTGAYRYVSKSDNNIYHSENHPPLESIGSPKTKKCVAAYRQKHAPKTNTSQTETNVAGHSGTSRKRSLSRLHVGDFVIKHNIRNENELFAAAKRRRSEGESDLADFIFRMNTKSRCDLIESAWKLEESDEIVARQNLNRMSVIKEAADAPCDEICNGIWFRCALEILQKNSINPCDFADSLRQLLEKGRGKYRNILITGRTNCAKTFILSPLSVVFKGALCNPSSTKFAWLGADTAEVIFLNDYRWSPEQIKWDQLLRLLEGHLVNLPAPMNHYSRDVCIDSDVPVFATSSEPIFYYEGNDTDKTKFAGENEQMRVRWKHFHFTYQIPVEEQIHDIPKCPSCFSNLVLLTENDFS